MDLTHIIGYDISGSTSSCYIEDYGEHGSRIQYFNYVKNILVRRIQDSNPGVSFTFIAWNNYAKITNGIVNESTGGTDPSDMFEMVEKKFPRKKLYIHFITDGDIYGFDFGTLNRFIDENRLKIDIYYVGNGHHNIEFYQKVKQKLEESCNVYVNNEHVQLIERVVDGMFYLTPEEESEILNHNYDNTELPCPPAFNKLMGTVTTHSGESAFRDIIDKTLRSLIQRSRGKPD